MTTKVSERVLRLDQITHAKISRLDRDRTVVIATMSPLEVHGPHLPLGQDLFEAYALAERTAARIVEKRPDWTVLLLPKVPVAVDCVPHLGSVAFPVTLVRDVAYHLLKPFAKNGFARLAFSSFHGGSRHFCALEDASERLTREFGVPAVSLFSAVLSRIKEGDVFFEGIRDTPGRTITVEQLKQDHHGAFVETSLGLHLWPELVEEGWQELPPLVSKEEVDREVNDSYLYGYDTKPSLAERVKRNAATVSAIYRAIKHYNEHTYHGYPALASAKQGRDLFDHLVNIAADAAGEFIEQGKSFDGHSPLWKLHLLLLNKSVNTVAEDWLGLYSE